jgi:hypothetical protein
MALPSFRFIQQRLGGFSLHPSFEFLYFIFQEADGGFLGVGVNGIWGWVSVPQAGLCQTEG